MEKYNKGSITLEILIAFSVLIISFGALINLYYVTDKTMADMKNSVEIDSETEEFLENTIVQGRIDFNSIIANDIDDITKDVNKDDFTIRVIDWRNARGYKNCSFNDDWSNLKIVGEITLDTSTTTDIVATDVINQGSYAYVTADSAVQNKEDFFIVDVSNPQNPDIISKIDTGPGLVALAVAGDYAYVGNSSTNAQLQIINIKDPYNPFIVSSYKLPGTYSGLYANSIFYSKKKVYLGTPKSSISELHIINVSDVYNPTEIGNWEANTTINAMNVKGNILYEASPNNEELKVLDISDFSNITQVSGFSEANNSGKSIYSVGTTTYLGHTTGGDFFVLDTSSTTPQKLGSYRIGSSINDIVGDKNLAFLVTTNKKLQVLSVLNPASISLVSSLDFSSKAVAIDCDEDVVYIAFEDNNALKIITPQ
ncbi:MAG: hypothetical protein NUV47_00390 [Patescibacteria group bacterium]|nr:hypothetical protein [Patescibacteria group bacterium]